MGLSKLHNVLWSVLAGFVGAGLFGLLLYGISVNAQDDRTVVKAHKFVVLNDNNEPVGTLASTKGPEGLPFMSLEGMHGEGAVFVGFLGPGHVQVRLYAGKSKGDAGLVAGDGSGGLLLGNGEEATVAMRPKDVKAIRHLVEQPQQDAGPKPSVRPKESR